MRDDGGVTLTIQTIVRGTGKRVTSKESKSSRVQEEGVLLQEKLSIICGDDEESFTIKNSQGYLIREVLSTTIH